MTQQVRVEVSGAVAQLVLCAPVSGNRVDVGFAQSLARAVEVVEADLSVRVLWLRAEGEHFSQGADVRAFHDRGDEVPNAVMELFEALNPALERLWALPVPSVAEVQGWCVGGALGLASMADVVVAGSGARFRAAFTGLAIPNTGGSTLGFASRMGMSAAKRFCLLNEAMDAEQAQQAGLVDVVVDEADLDQTAREFAERLAAGPTLAYVGIRRNFARVPTSLAGSLADEVESVRACAGSEDVAEAVGAFMEKRRPGFRGR
ncbi:enoyl-CoA hydratase/isomerase family protein [Luteococcus sp.]|uniref:enoyl-CoA hydratase/isomerase family protein n=1 Tax=Luteococcus sp. TaxID=1969402 RepID=UPI003734C3E8